MSDRSSTAALRDHLTRNPPSWVTAVALALAMGAGGGGLGTALTGSSVRDELRLFRSEWGRESTEIKGELKRIGEKLDDATAQRADLETRLRAVEKATYDLRALSDRVTKLEGR